MCIDIWNTNIVSLIANSFEAATLIVAVATLINDHRRSKKESSVRLSTEWTEKLDIKTNIAKKYVEDFTEDKINDLYNFKEIIFNPEDKTEKEAYIHLKKLLGGMIDESYYLTIEESSELRYLMLRYLNTLESILIAWKNNSVDRKTIEEEFSYMFNSEQKKHLLTKLTNAFGKENFPAISKFEKHVSKKLGNNKPTEK